MRVHNPMQRAELHNRSRHPADPVLRDRLQLSSSHLDGHAGKGKQFVESLRTSPRTAWKPKPHSGAARFDYTQHRHSRDERTRSRAAESHAAADYDKIQKNRRFIEQMRAELEPAVAPLQITAPGYTEEKPAEPPHASPLSRNAEKTAFTVQYQGSIRDKLKAFANSPPDSRSALIQTAPAPAQPTGSDFEAFLMVSDAPVLGLVQQIVQIGLRAQREQRDSEQDVIEHTIAAAAAWEAAHRL